MQHDDQQKSEFEQLADEKSLPIWKEFGIFILENKAWWLVPILVMIALIGVLVMLSGTGAAPFIYTLF